MPAQTSARLLERRGAEVSERAPAFLPWSCAAAAVRLLSGARGQPGRRTSERTPGAGGAGSAARCTGMVALAGYFQPSCDARSIIVKVLKACGEF